MKLKDLIEDLTILHQEATPGKWGKGRTSHETVASVEGKEPYKVADFRHAKDAAFADVAHLGMQKLLEATKGEYIIQAIEEKIEALILRDGKEDLDTGELELSDRGREELRLYERMISEVQEIIKAKMEEE